MKLKSVLIWNAWVELFIFEDFIYGILYFIRLFLSILIIYDSELIFLEFYFYSFLPPLLKQPENSYPSRNAGNFIGSASFLFPWQLVILGSDAFASWSWFCFRVNNTGSVNRRWYIPTPRNLFSWQPFDIPQQESWRAQLPVGHILISKGVE